MRIPTNVKEVKQLIGCLTALSRFLLCVGDKDFLLFTSLKKKERFEWTSKLEEDFSKVNDFLTSPSILTRLREESLLLLYL